MTSGQGSWGTTTKRQVPNSLPRWLILGGVFLLICGLSLSLDRLRQYVVNQYELTTRLAEASSVSNQLSALEWQAIGTGRLTPELREQAQQQLKQLDRLKAQLPDDRQLLPVKAALGRFNSALSAEFAALQEGDVTEAREIDEAQVDPAFEELEELLVEAAVTLKARAARAERTGQVGSVTVVFLALLLMFLLAWIFERLSGQMRAAVAERQRQEELESRDLLTGLLNRAGLTRIYAELPPGRPLAVAMADLNDLKTTNDLGGHNAGDVLLRGVADALTEGLLPGALIARWGGDEFVILLPNHDQTQATFALNAVRRGLGLNPLGRGVFSFGVGTAVAGETLERPLAVADAAMYEHKALTRKSKSGGHSTELGSVEEFVARLANFTCEHDILTQALPMARALLGFDLMIYVEPSGSGRGAPDHGDAKIPYQLRAFDSAAFQLPEHLAEGRDMPYLGGVISAALESGRTHWSNDYASDPVAVPALSEYQIKSCGASPVMVRGETRGAVVVAHVQTWRPITPQVRRVLEALAQHLAGIHERCRMVSELRQALEGGQRALGIALELRDHETAGHTERLVQLSAELGQRLGLHSDALQLLRQGAYLHDLGKITVPDAVLLKPGRFTPEERTVMETHALRGFEIASQIAGLPQGTLDVIRFHHERWDGSGYPDRLVGEQIPLLARIFAVCDVYDALISERPYKAAWSRQEALAELRAQSGRHFDPVVVEAFVALQTAPPFGTGPTAAAAKLAAQGRA